MTPTQEWDSASGLLGLVPLRLTVPGVPAAVPVVRRFVRSVLTDHPAREDVELLISEVTTNAIRHTASGQGGEVTVTVAVVDGGLVHVTVTDDGAATEPVAQVYRDTLAESGNGLLLVQAIAKQHGTWTDGTRRTCWFEVGA